MRVRAGLCVFLLGRFVELAGGDVAKGSRRRQEAEDRGASGFLGRAFQQAKRLGEAIDPDAVAQVGQAWKELAPDLRQVAADVLQAKKDVQTAGEEVGGIWSDVKLAVSELGSARGESTAENGASAHEVTAGFGWEELKRDARSAAKGVVGDVLGEVADEILGTFEAGLAEALSERNVRVASRLWSRLLDLPGLKLLASEGRLWVGAERVLRQHLRGYMSERAAVEAERAVIATADFALHFAGLSRNARLSEEEVFAELSSKLCHLQGAAEKLWPLAVRALPLVGCENYVAAAERVIRSNALSRITQTVSASVLLGLNPRDPFLLTVIASFSLGHLTKDVAENMVAVFQKVFLDQITLSQQATEQASFPSDGEGATATMSAVDLVTELVSGKNTCQQLGQQALSFFKMVRSAVAESPLSTREGSYADNNNGGNPTTQTSTASQQPRPLPQSPHQTGSPRTPVELKLDGIILRHAIWVAAVVDNERFSLDIFVACLVAGALFVCVSVGVCVCRRWGRRGRAGRNLKEAAAGAKPDSGRRTVSVVKRDKVE